MTRTCVVTVYANMNECRIKKLKSFADVMSTVGVKKDSIGCEVCKPAIGSILASLWNEHIMNPIHHAYVLISAGVNIV